MEENMIFLLVILLIIVLFAILLVYMINNKHAHSIRTIKTVAGKNITLPNPISATQVVPDTLYVDKPTGTLYVSQNPSMSSYIRKIDASGMSTMFISPISLFDSLTTLNSPFPSSLQYGITRDSSGNTYMVDRGNHVVRQITATGTVSVFAGVMRINGYNGDHIPANSATLNSPTFITTDLSNNIYISDSGNNRIRKVDVNGMITTVAGGGADTTGNGISATTFQFNFPTGLVFDSQGSLYISDRNKSRIRKMDRTGTLTLFAGGGTDISGTTRMTVALNAQNGLAVDKYDSIYVADSNNQVIRKIDTTGNVSIVGGTLGVIGYSGDGGLATQATFSRPLSVDVDDNNSIYISDVNNKMIRKIDSSGYITTLSNNYNITNQRITTIELQQIGDVAVDRHHNFYFSIYSQIIKVNQSGIATIIAGTPYNADGYKDGSGSYSGDGGLATQTTLSAINGLCMDNTDIMYFVESDSNVVRKINKNGIITTIAGTGTADYTGDGGKATSATLRTPTGMCIDRYHTIYIADRGNNVIRRVDTNGIITTIAGSRDKSGYSGDGDLATNATLNGPFSVCVDTTGNIYISDTGNNVIRKVDAVTQIITTIAGSSSGSLGYSGDGGLAKNALLSYPLKIIFDALQQLYICDANNNVIRMIDKHGIITTIVGNGSFGNSGDGYDAHNAELSSPNGICVDQDRNIYIADTFNNVVRYVSMNK